MKRRVDLVDVHHHFGIFDTIDLGGLDQGVAGAYPVVHGHVRSGHPRIGPRLRIRIVQRSHQVLEDLQCLFLVALDEVSPRNDIVVVVNPLVELRSLEVLLLTA